MSIEDFMKSPLVRWVQLFVPDPVTYGILCDGAFLGEVIRKIDPGANLMGMNVMTTEFRERLQNWDIVINSIVSYYQTVLQQFVIMRLPNIVTICKLPYSEVARQEMERALLLVLGCAVQCEQRQSFIEKIKSLDLSDQEIIMHSITEVTDCPANILSVESLGGKLDDRPGAVCSYVIQLLRERQENRSQIQDVMLALEELQKEKEKSRQTGSEVESNTQFTSNVTQSKSKNNVNLPTQIRRLQLELDEKTAENQELHEELDHLNQTAEKLRNENVDLIKEASAARAYRDELDIVQEKANLAKKYEFENTKLREKLSELDFLRARVKEFSSENSLLLESKLEVEEKLLMSEKQFEAVRDLEEQLNHCKRHLEAVAAERDSERRKLLELGEENARLVLEQTTSQSQNISLEEELKSVRRKSDSHNAMSLSEQLSEMATSKLRRLELENQQLRKQTLEHRNDSSTPMIEELKRENARLFSKVEALEQTVAEDKRTGAELKQIKLLQQSSVTEDGSRVHLQSVRLSDSIGEPDVRNFKDKNDEKLLADLRTVRSDMARISFDHRQIMIKHEAVTSESSQRMRALEEERDELDQENAELKNTVAGLRLIFDKYSDAEKTAVELRVENVKLTKKLSALESSVARVTALEQENARLKIDVECLQRTVGNQKNSSSKLVDLEHENDIMNRQLVQLQNSLESSKVDRITITTLENDLTMAIDEKIKLKRRLESAMSELESSHASYVQLESQNNQLQKSAESFETVKKKFDSVQHENDKLESENQRLMTGKSLLEKENMRLRQIGEERKVSVEELSGKLVELEGANKELLRNLERNHWSKEMESWKETDRKQDFQQTLDLEKEHQQQEELIVEQLKSSQLSSIPVQVVAPSRTGASSSSSVLSLNMTNAMTEHLDNGAYALEHGRGHGWRSSLDPVDLDVEPRRDIVRLERKNAVLEEDNRNLKANRSQLQMRLEETERQYSVANSELSSVRGQNHALQVQLEKVQAESLLLAPKNALHEAENASLNKECADLRLRLSQTLDKERELSLINMKRELEIENTSKQMDHLSSEHTHLKSDHVKLKLELQEISNKHSANERDFSVLKSRHSELEAENLELQSEHSRLKSEHNELVSEHSELMMDHKVITEQANKLEEQCFQLTKEVEDLSLSKVQNDERNAESTSDRSAELVDARTEIVRLRREASDGQKSLERLQAENEKVKEKLSRMIRRQEDVEKDLSDAKEQLIEAVKENNKLASKCEVSSQLQLRLEEENHALMIQLQALMNQNHDLLTQILNNKDHHFEEQKSYLNQLSELRRQKEKLEEKLIEQSRQKETAKKKNKGFGAFVKRAFLKDKRGKERNKAGNDHELSRRTLSELELAPRTTDEHNASASVSVNSLVTPPPIKRETNSQNDGEGVYRNGGDVPDNVRMQAPPRRKVVASTSAEPVLEGVGEDEQITLEEFLQECNQTPMARKKLLTLKRITAGGNEGHPGMHERDSHHRSSHLTLFPPQQNTRSSDNIGTSRRFQSELNLFQGSQPRSSETSSSNITSTPIRRSSHKRRETRAVKEPNAELVQTVKAHERRNSNEQNRHHQRIASSASNVMTENSFCRVITTQADVTLSSSVTNLRQDPPPLVSNTSFSSDASSQLSHASSKQSFDASHISHNSASSHKTNFSDTDNVHNIQPGGKTIRASFNKQSTVESNICHDGPSPYDRDISERPVSSSSSSSSAQSTQKKPIPFIDELERDDEVTFRESNVCI